MHSLHGHSLGYAQTDEWLFPQEAGRASSTEFSVPLLFGKLLCPSCFSEQVQEGREEQFDKVSTAGCVQLKEHHWNVCPCHLQLAVTPAYCNIGYVEAAVLFFLKGGL